MQAVSVKVGDTYGADYVNNLYNQLLTFDKNSVYYCLCDNEEGLDTNIRGCLLYTSPSPRDLYQSRMPSSA